MGISGSTYQVFDYLYAETEGLPNIEELDAHLISNFTGPINEFEFLDITKK